MTDSVIKQSLADTYTAMALEYERAVVPLFRPMARRLVQRVGLRPGDQVLDGGTGTGLVALFAAPKVGQGGKVIGVDRADKMLELARGKARQFGFSQCEFQSGDLEALEFADAHFNAVLAQFALHHTDLAQALSELRRVLKPDGVLAINEWMESSHTPNQVLFEATRQYFVTEPNETLAQIRAQSARAHEFRVKVAKPEVLDRAMKEAGLVSTQIHEEEYVMRVANVDAFLAMAAASPLFYAELAALPVPLRGQIFEEARQKLQKFESSNGLEWRYKVIAVVARQ